MDTWSNASRRGIGTPSCYICHGARFVHPVMSSGELDFSEIYPCLFNDQYRAYRRDEAGDIVNQCWDDESRKK